MNQSQSQSHETIVVGVDGSAASDAAVRWAAAETRRRRARLHAVHVVDPGRREDTSSDHDMLLELELARRSVPGRVADWTFAQGTDVDIAVSVVTGHAAATLARESGDASLVVIGIPDSLHHSDLPIDLARGCRCPVVVVGPFGDATYVHVSTTPGTKGASHARA